MTSMDLAFSILWEELRGELMKADLYKKRNQMIKDGEALRSLIKEDYIKNEIKFQLKEEQEKQYKKTQFYSGILKAMEKGE